MLLDRNLIHRFGIVNEILWGTVGKEPVESFYVAAYEAIRRVRCVVLRLIRVSGILKPLEQRGWHRQRPLYRDSRGVPGGEPIGSWMFVFLESACADIFAGQVFPWEGYEIYHPSSD